MSHRHRHMRLIILLALSIALSLLAPAAFAAPSAATVAQPGKGNENNDGAEAVMSPGFFFEPAESDEQAVGIFKQAQEAQAGLEGVGEQITGGFE